MKKLFVCDFDGCLYIKNNVRAFNRALDIIHKARCIGHEFMVATGRPLHLLEPYFPSFSDMYFISNDGALFSRGFDILKSFPLDKDRIKSEYSDYHGDFVAYGNCISYLHVKSKSRKLTLDKFYRGHITDTDCVCSIDEDIYKISFLSPHKSPSFMDKCWDSYGVREYVAKDVSKGSMLKWIQAKYGFTKENTIAIGDGLNDISMMNYAGTSYVMMSAPPGVKSAADKLTDSVSDVIRGECNESI